MRLYIDLVSGECFTSWPGNAGVPVNQEVKALKGERMEIRWMKAGVVYEMPASTEIKVMVYDRAGGTKLAELTSLTTPTDVATGFYEGRLSFNTQAVQDMLTASLTKSVFAAVMAVMWKIPSVGEWEETDNIVLSLQRSVGGADDDPVELADPWNWLKQRLPEAGGFTHNNSAKTMSVIVTQTQVLTLLQNAIDGNGYINLPDGRRIAVVDAP